MGTPVSTETAILHQLLAELAREVPQAPEDEKHQVSCDGLKAEFKRLFDQCMRDADKGWGDCKKSWGGSVGSAAWELFMGICDDKKDEAEEKCRTDDENRQGLLAGLCD